MIWSLKRSINKNKLKNINLKSPFLIVGES